MFLQVKFCSISSINLSITPHIRNLGSLPMTLFLSFLYHLFTICAIAFKVIGLLNNTKEIFFLFFKKEFFLVLPLLINNAKKLIFLLGSPLGHLNIWTKLYYRGAGEWKPWIFSGPLIKKLLIDKVAILNSWPAFSSPEIF